MLKYVELFKKKNIMDIKIQKKENLRQINNICVVGNVYVCNPRHLNRGI